MSLCLDLLIFKARSTTRWANQTSQVNSNTEMGHRTLVAVGDRSTAVVDRNHRHSSSAVEASPDRMVSSMPVEDSMTVMVVGHSTAGDRSCHPGGAAHGEDTHRAEVAVAVDSDRAFDSLIDRSCLSCTWVHAV